MKLSAELASRGISKDIIREELDLFFQENSEEDFCRKAYEKCIRQGKSEEKIIRTLIMYGFTHNMIKNVISEKES